MDVFAFASQTETQGMVLTEAMAAGVPVVALDAPGVREVVRDQLNGRLLLHEDTDEFVAALSWVASLSSGERRRLGEGATRTASEFSMERTATRTLTLYESLVGVEPKQKELGTSLWTAARRRLAGEWKILRLTKAGISDLVRELACGLHNLRVSCRHPLPAFDLLSLVSSG